MIPEAFFYSGQLITRDGTDLGAKALETYRLMQEVPVNERIKYFQQYDGSAYQGVVELMVERNTAAAKREKGLLMIEHLDLLLEEPAPVRMVDGTMDERVPAVKMLRGALDQQTKRLHAYENILRYFGRKLGQRA